MDLEHRSPRAPLLLVGLLPPLDVVIPVHFAHRRHGIADASSGPSDERIGHESPRAAPLRSTVMSAKAPWQLQTMFPTGCLGRVAAKAAGKLGDYIPMLDRDVAANERLPETLLDHGATA